MNRGAEESANEKRDNDEFKDPIVLEMKVDKALVPTKTKL